MQTNDTINTKTKGGGGQIEGFKILNGHENSDSDIFFSKLTQMK